MFRAFALSIAQLGDPRIVRVFLKSIALTILLLATAGVALWYAMHRFVIWLGADARWADVAGVLAVIGGVAIGWLVFRALAIAAIGVFADEVVAAVEARHYPQALARARPVPMWQGAMMGMRSAVRALLVNLIALPLYAVLLVTGIGTAAAFFVINAWLLGRDLGDMVAVRHMDASALPVFRRHTRIERWLLGMADTALLFVPIVNLAAPILGAAAATHLFHRRFER